MGLVYKLSSTTLHDFTPAPGGTIAFAGVLRNARQSLYPSAV
jgi:hypothetical protein